MNVRKGAQCRYASEVTYAGHILKKISPTTHLGVCVCVCVFALFKESLQAKKPLNLSQRKCIYEALHLIIRLKLTFRSLPNNMDD